MSWRPYSWLLHDFPVPCREFRGSSRRVLLLLSGMLLAYTLAVGLLLGSVSGVQSMH